MVNSMVQYDTVVVKKLISRNKLGIYTQIAKVCRKTGRDVADLRVGAIAVFDSSLVNAYGSYLGRYLEEIICDSRVVLIPLVAEPDGDGFGLKLSQLLCVVLQ